MMSKHVQAKILKAYADNTELNIFISEEGGDKWIRTNPKALMDYPERDFFACLPQHNESGQCLHWLNGGKSQLECTHASYPVWNDIDNDAMIWSSGHVFMDSGLNIRTKPRKEKRFALVGNDFRMGVMTFNSKEELEQYYAREISNGQIVEFDVEI